VLKQVIPLNKLRKLKPDFEPYAVGKALNLNDLILE
jgi:hypothetical protein